MSELDANLTTLNRRLLRAKIDAFQRGAFANEAGVHSYKLAVWKIKDVYRGKACSIARGDSSIDQPFPPDVNAAVNAAAAAVDAAAHAAIYSTLALPLAAAVEAPLMSAALTSGRHAGTSELNRVLIGFNVRLLEIQLHHVERTGVGQMAAFSADVESAIENCQRKLDNLAVREAIDVAAARAEIAALATAATAGAVEVPAAS